MTIDATSASDARPARRTLLTTAAWTVPVIAAAVATPARAASITAVAVCDPSLNNGAALPTIAGSWGPQAGLEQIGGEYETGYTSTGFQSWKDNASLSGDKDFLATYTFEAARGGVYELEFIVNTSAGNGTGGASGSAPQGVTVGIGAEVFVDVRTNARDNYNPTQSVDGQVQVAWWDGYSASHTATYTAVDGGLVTIDARFSLAARGGAGENGTDAQVNDDIVLSRPTFRQIGCVPDSV